MAIHLLDVNVLVALAWPNHAHHRLAKEWRNAHAGQGWATCPLTQTGFVRVSSNRKIIPEARSPKRAIRLLGRLIADESHIFWNDDLMMTESEFIALEGLRGHKQITDAYLLGLAIRNSGKLVTFDVGIESLARTKHERDAIELIPSTPS